MTEREHFAACLNMACDTSLPDTTRADCVMRTFFMARANLKGLLGIVDSTAFDDPMHRLAQDQLDAIHGFLTEQGIGENKP